jgi:predicted peptidase
LAASVLASADTGFLDRSLVLGGTVRRYQVYVPFDYSKSTMWPLIVSLHGNTLQGDDGVLHTSVGLANQIRRTRSRFPAVVLLPQAPSGGRWEQAELQNMILAQLDRTIAEFRIDPERVYLTGDSMGGTGALRVLYCWPERFAGVAIVAGRVRARDSAAGGADRKDNAFVAAQDPFSALAERVRRLPIRLFHGTSDQTNSVDESRRLAAALKSAGANVSLVEYPDSGHVDGITKAYAEPDFAAWLLSNRRKSAE